MRQTLVILQFSVLIGLSLSTAVIYRQTQFAIRNGLRLQSDQTIVVTCEEGCADAFIDQLRALPGVRAAATSWIMPLTDSSSSTTVKSYDGTDANLRYDVAGPGYFEMYGVTPIAGRLFNRRSTDIVRRTDGVPQTNPPVVINETARKMLGFLSPGEAIGQTFAWKRVIDFDTREITPELPSVIIGVVPDFALDSIRLKIDPAFFYADERLFNRVSIRLKSDQMIETLAAIDRLWNEGQHTRPILRSFLDRDMEALYHDVTRQSQLFTIFAGVALFIACLGLLGLSAFVAESRTKEIGIRKAMGASKIDMLRMLLWQFARPVLWANLIAWPAAGYLMHRWLEGFAYHIELSAWMFLAASALAVTIAVITVVSHALLVARAQPVHALRYE